jgi:putative copper resistance protein D
VWRLVAYQLGILAVAVSVVSPLEYYGNEVLWINFVGFLVLTMMAPPLIILGQPLTLAFRVSGPTGRRRLRAAYRSVPMTMLTFPVVSWLGFAALTYIWQFSSWTDIAAHNDVVRDLQQSTLLVMSLAFWLVAVASDPMRWRVPYQMRALYVFVEMTHKGLFGGMFLSATSPFHPRFAAGLPAWGPSPMLDQHMAIMVLWIGGNMIFLVCLISIVVAWLRFEARNAQRTDWRLAKAREAQERRRAALEKVFEKTV